MSRMTDQVLTVIDNQNKVSRINPKINKELQ